MRTSAVAFGLMSFILVTYIVAGLFMTSVSLYVNGYDQTAGIIKHAIHNFRK